MNWKNFSVIGLALITPHSAHAATYNAGRILPESGLWVNPVWLLTVIIAISFWVYLSAWVADNALGIGLNHHFWTGLFVGVGWAGAILMLFLHPVFAIFSILGFCGLLSYYFTVHNRKVPIQFQILPKFLGTEEAKLDSIPAEEKKQTKGLSKTAQFINNKGKEIGDYVEKHPDFEEPLSIICEFLEYVFDKDVEELHVKPGKSSYIVEIKKDSVHSRLEQLDPNDAKIGVAAFARFCGLSSQKNPQTYLKLVMKEKDTQLSVELLKLQGKASLVFKAPQGEITLHKENLVKLGMQQEIGDMLQTTANTPGASIIVSAPPKSGLTTSLYAVVSLVDIFMNDVVLFENKNEGELDQVKRVEVNLDSPEEFNKALPPILRGEPDILVAGDFKNQQVAEKYLDFAQEDGRIIGAVNGNNAAEVLIRLTKQLPPDKLANTVKAITNQRLMRRLCFECKEEILPSPKLLSKLKIDPEDPGKWFKPVGCDSCLQTGYDGLIGVFEVLFINDDLAEFISSGNISLQIIKKTAPGDSYHSIYKSALEHVKEGVTTLNELKRVLK